MGGFETGLTGGLAAVVVSLEAGGFGGGLEGGFGLMEEVVEGLFEGVAEEGGFGGLLEKEGGSVNCLPGGEERGE